MASSSRGDLPPYMPFLSDFNNQFKNLGVSSGDCDLPYPLAVSGAFEWASEFLDFIGPAFDGLKARMEPYRSPHGEGGTYWLKDPSGKKVAVFKPIDEEPCTTNNPQRTRSSPSFKVDGLRKGIKPGRGAIREFLAYICDHPMSCRRKGCYGDVKGSGGVPPTTLAKCVDKNFYHFRGFEYKVENIKRGSLQKYEDHEGNCERSPPWEASVEEVHKITLLDIRYANTDRHGGNILHRKEDDKIKLIPIDHGYCFPETFEECNFCWLDWPQAAVPYSPEFVNYIKTLDADKDIALAEGFLVEITLKIARVYRISTLLLKKGVEEGLTPCHIGSIMCRKPPKEKSIIEKIVRAAIEKIVDDAIASEESLMGEESLTREQVIDNAEEHSELKIMTRPESEIMTKAEFEKKLIETVLPIMESEIKIYKEKLESEIKIYKEELKRKREWE